MLRVNILTKIVLINDKCIGTNFENKSQVIKKNTFLKLNPSLSVGSNLCSADSDLYRLNTKAYRVQLLYIALVIARVSDVHEVGDRGFVCAPHDLLGRG